MGISAQYAEFKKLAKDYIFQLRNRKSWEVGRWPNNVTGFNAQDIKSKLQVAQVLRYKAELRLNTDDSVTLIFREDVPSIPWQLT